MCKLQSRAWANFILLLVLCRVLVTCQSAWPRLICRSLTTLNWRDALKVDSIATTHNYFIIKSKIGCFVTCTVIPLHNSPLGAEEKDCSRGWLLWDGRGVIWHLFFSGCNICLFFLIFFFPKMHILAYTCINENVSLKQKLTETKTYDKQVWIKFGDLKQCKSGVLHTLLISHWLTGCCRVIF